MFSLTEERKVFKVFHLIEKRNGFQYRLSVDSLILLGGGTHFVHQT